MTPVMQTRTDYPYGNCLSACIASLLDLPLTVVPDLSPASCPTWKDINQRLRSIGYVLTSAVGRTGRVDVLIGTSPRDPRLRHAVLADGQGNLVHDPYPREMRNIVHPPFERMNLMRV